MTHYLMKLASTVAFLKCKDLASPQVGIILGSGLGNLVREVAIQEEIPYQGLPYFPTTTVAGHAGSLIFGILAGKQTVIMRGRFHYYEGYSLEEVTYPVRVMHRLGVKNLVVTNAAGGIRSDLRAADLMLITDHLNLIGQNPLRGHNFQELGPRFPDMSTAYHPELQELARHEARILNIPLAEGVYAAVAGPSFETPAELKYLSIIGADAVGMSTVPEVIVANHGGMKVLGISCITNTHTGGVSVQHEDVLKVADQAGEKLVALVKAVILKL
jgi:purine-nucleoside phosphorylase